MKKNIALAASFLLAAASLVGCESAKPASSKPVSSIELVSPNGKNKIVLSAMDKGCGIWAGPADMATGPMVAIYTQLDDPNTGVVGVWGPGHIGGPIDIGIVGDGGGGHVQVANRQDDGSKPLHFWQSKAPSDK